MHLKNHSVALYPPGESPNPSVLHDLVPVLLLQVCLPHSHPHQVFQSILWIKGKITQNFSIRQKDAYISFQYHAEVLSDRPAYFSHFGGNCSFVPYLDSVKLVLTHRRLVNCKQFLSSGMRIISVHLKILPQRLCFIALWDFSIW